MSETSNIAGLLEEIKRNREEIATDSYTTSWREIINLYKEGDIKISPEYQRLFRWDMERQTQFIESLLLNIPVPTLFFYIDEDGRQEVIDGLQRISTIIRFFARDIFTKDELEEGIASGGVNELNNPTVLGSAPIIPSLEGWNAADLPDKVTRTIKNARVNIVILEQETKPQTKYNVFKRLNRSGAKLSDQEIRNCTARLVGNSFADKLRSIASNDDVIGALGLSKEKQKTQAGEEALLRTLASLLYADNFDHYVDEFLDDFMYVASETNAINAEIETKIKRTFSLINAACPNGKAFKFRKVDNTPSGPFSTNLLDIVATGVYKNVENLSSADVSDKLDTLWERQREQINQCTGSGSNTKAKLKRRLEIGEEAFK
ncbi:MULTISPECIES: DUF262 domain-containing protein [Vibrio harveyi group]|uniref:DUF262 domain-containing protein n=1 Tax=Vibrio harveyi group TaxID=717610 RepID=UPI0013755EDC|nr:MULTISPECIES: DUF262 domain-containing protein [Vibrio harveyi group]EGR1192370.1 DUF262 domain-containing protein [Vibrio parahaemolyticus]EGR1207471.1 DUF262 domain-containing protein [Vibrio parahaemolyticus]EGR1212501.1 DUF262 domain-containing protein [Vibrio parahaemolyticus]MBM5143407.1 DUF262 domain-containing protein [Vibrio parahaemolyticus]MBM5216869.1 DUF262 domain-containing protein [Vibrio parahaemolyticus]